jgi:hypothetical protein
VILRSGQLDLDTVIARVQFYMVLDEKMKGIVADSAPTLASRGCASNFIPILDFDEHKDSDIHTIGTNSTPTPASVMCRPLSLDASANVNVYSPRRPRDMMVRWLRMSTMLSDRR